MWIVETLNANVDAQLEALPPDMRARFVSVAGLIESLGLEQVGGPYIDHVGGPLWEIRIKGKDGITQAFYISAYGKRLVVERVFVMKNRRRRAPKLNLP
jgi:phage-related protein